MNDLAPIRVESPGFPAPAASFDLMAAILTGLAPRSAAGYRKDFRAFAAFMARE